MASTNALRNAQFSKRTVPSPATKPRAAPRRLDDEVTPADSASNIGLASAGHRRAISGAGRPSTTSQRTGQERRSERRETTTRDKVQVRTRSPVKLPKYDGEHEDHEAPRPSTKQSQRHESTREEAPLRKAVPPWKPAASLVSHTTAPLASRISLPPSAALIPETLEPPPLKGMSSDAQESAMLEDLLFAFMGYEGQYIHFVGSYDAKEEKSRLAGPDFRILPGLDPSLRDLTTTMLKMATHYVAVEAFVEVQSREEFGTINHALCAAIRTLLREYLVLIAQMEHQLLTNESFTLHVLHLHVQPTMHTLFQLFTLAQEMLKKNKMLEEEDDSDESQDYDDIIEQLREGGELGIGSKKIQIGGNVLRLLSERLSYMSGDPAARKLLEGLLRDASRPYMAMLNEWLHHGTIKDPHDEFLIREQKSLNRDNLEIDFTDQYWEKRYTIRDHDVPPQLVNVKDKVLLAGKYLNVVRECGGVDVSKEFTDVPTTFEDPRFLKNINDAYAHANSSLLNLIIGKNELTARLKSLKHYFFLDRSDYFSYFLYLSNSELKKPAREVNTEKLQSLLDIVLRQPGSVAAADPFKEDVKIHLNNATLTRFLVDVMNVKGFDDGADGASLLNPEPSGKDHAEEAAKMTGYDALEFKYSVPFPLSLVISSKTVVRYQILFRYLVSMRHVEGLLLSSWEDHNKVITWLNKSGDRKIEIWKRRVWTLRARMLNFVQQLTYYCTAEVIEPNWNTLMEKVRTVDTSRKTVDELMEDHIEFLDNALKECMLMNPKLLKIQDKILNVCTFFAAYTSSMSRNLCAADPKLAGTPEAMEYLKTVFPSPRHPIPDKFKTYDATLLPKIIDMLEKYEDNFNRHIRILLDALDYYAATETITMSRLCAQLTASSEKGGEGRE